jgi:hypothetical protein
MENYLSQRFQNVADKKFLAHLYSSKTLKYLYHCFLVVSLLVFSGLSSAESSSSSNFDAFAKQAIIFISTDNAEEVYFNGKRFGSSNQWKQAKTYKVALQKGKNVLAIKATNKDGIAGLISQITIGNKILVSDAKWKVSTTKISNWNRINLNDSKWVATKTYGKYGTSPWKKNVKAFPENSSAQWIWSKNRKSDNTVYFRYTLNIGSESEGQNEKPIEVTTQLNSLAKIDVTEYAAKFKKVSIISKPSHGRVSIQRGKVINYKPKSGYTGQDIFVVKILDSNGSTKIASITVTVGKDKSFGKGDNITLQWKPGSNNVLGYVVYYGPTSGTVTTMLSDLHIESKEINAKSPSVTYNIGKDIGLEPGKFACFRVRAYGIAGESNFSKPVCTKT